MGNFYKLLNLVRGNFSSENVYGLPNTFDKFGRDKFQAAVYHMAFLTA